MAKTKLPKALQEWNDYVRHGGGSEWFPLHLETLFLLRRNEALLMSALLRLGKIRYRKGAIKRDGFFKCTTNYLLGKFNFSAGEQKRYLKSLKTSGYIEVKQLGMPAVRYVRIQMAKYWSDWVEIGHARMEETRQKHWYSGDDSQAGRKRTTLVGRKRTTIKSNTLTGIPSVLIKNPVGSASQEPTEGDMGFLPNLKPTSPSVKQRHLKLADTLHTVIVTKTAFRRKWSRKKWAGELATLEQEVGRDRMELVLDWYLKNIKTSFVPEAYSAKTFRQKFPRIERAMQRAVPETQPVSKFAKNIADAVAELGWPKGSASQLPSVVQASVDGFAAYVIKHHALRDALLRNSKRDKDVLLFLDEIEVELGTAQSFVTRWLTWIHARVAGWVEWSGELRSYAFSQTSKLFHQWGRKVATDFAGSVQGPALWDRYLKLLN